MRIVLIHNHTITSAGIQMAIGEIDDPRPNVYAVTTYSDAQEIVNRLNIDIAVCQVQNSSNAVGARSIAKAGITCIVLLEAVHSSIVRPVITGGKIIPLFWRATTPDILRQTLLATQHESILKSAEVFQSVLDHQASSIADSIGIFSKLGSNHIDTLTLLASGKQPTEIIDELGMDKRTIYAHLRDLRDFFGVDNNIALAIAARDAGIAI